METRIVATPVLTSSKVNCWIALIRLTPPLGRGMSMSCGNDQVWPTGNGFVGQRDRHPALVRRRRRRRRDRRSRLLHRASRCNTLPLASIVTTDSGTPTDLATSSKPTGGLASVWLL